VCLNYIELLVIILQKVVYNSAFPLAHLPDSKVPLYHWPKQGGLVNWGEQMPALLQGRKTSLQGVNLCLLSRHLGI
jgi:hypothetical protein